MNKRLNENTQRVWNNRNRKVGAKAMGARYGVHGINTQSPTKIQIYFQRFYGFLPHESPMEVTLTTAP